MKNLSTRKKYTTESYENIYDEVKELIGEFQEKDYDYTKHFMNNGYYSRNHNSDINKLKIFLKKNGHYLDRFMKKYKSKIYDDDFFIANSGFMDSLLYEYDNKFPLSGGILEDYGDDEFLIKYFYDYDKYDLGKKYLLQYYDNVKDFYHDCAKNFLDEFKNGSETLNLFDGFNNVKDGFSIIKEISLGYLCIINTKLYYQHVNNEYTDVEDFIKHLKSDFRDFKLKESRFEYNFIDSKLIVVAFGKNILLNDIGLDFDKYEEIIDMNNSIKKYNL